MSKYIDKDKVLEYIIFGVVGKEITCGELKRAIESLPTIEVSEDTISRRDLLEQIEKDSEGSPGYYGDTWQFIKTIENAPSVVPKVPSDDNKAYTYCSRCGMRVVVDAPSVTTEQSSKVLGNEADMRGSDNICGECRWIGHDYDSDDWECRNEDSEKYRWRVDWLGTCEEWEQRGAE